jgi:ubiquinol-cytochrome c reductase cytochrome c subunit
VRPGRLPRGWPRLGLAALLGAAALWLLAAPRAPAQDAPGPQVPRSNGVQNVSGQVARGRAIFLASCSSCHGEDARGIDQRGPSLIGVGAAAVDFYVSTGRMPLARPGIQPHREQPIYSRPQIDALIAYVTSLGGGGPAIPVVRPDQGDLRLGQRRFADLCSGCHQIMAQGGIAPGLVAPPPTNATATQIGEAIRVGPYLMPRFSSRQLDDHEVDSIARYIGEVAADPPDRGGWGIGHIGPIPEGLVAFLLAGTALVLVARVIGERTET